MELKKIDWYDNYIVSNLNVFGVEGKELISIIPEDKDGEKYRFNNFFKLDGKVYFSIKTSINGDAIPETDPVQYKQVEKMRCYQQESALLKEVDESVYPELPESKRVEMEELPFKIETFVYKDADTSRVFIGSEVIGFALIDGYILVDNGILFSVAETVETRYEGLYYWQAGKANIRLLDSGRIW